MKAKILLSFLIYGLLVGIFSVWWRGVSDAIFVFNIPGVLLGDEVYSLSIFYLGDPNSPQAHYSILWILRIPQVYIPGGMVGSLVQLVYYKKRDIR